MEFNFSLKQADFFSIEFYRICSIVEYYFENESR